MPTSGAATKNKTTRHNNKNVLLSCADNAGKTKSNKHKLPFRIAYYKESVTRTEAVKKEKYWKTAAGRRYLQTKLNLVA